MMVRITIPGRPVPKGRPRLGKSGNVYTPRRTWEFENLVGWCTKQKIERFLEGNIAIFIRVYVKNDVFPDIDNIAKSILDGMQGIAYKNDRQVSYLVIQRIKDKEERVEIELEEVKNNKNNRGDAVVRG